MTQMQTILAEQIEQLSFDELMLIIKAENVKTICEQCVCYDKDCPYTWAQGQVCKICPALRTELEDNDES